MFILKGRNVEVIELNGVASVWEYSHGAIPLKLYRGNYPTRREAYKVAREIEKEKHRESISGNS